MGTSTAATATGPARRRAATCVSLALAGGLLLAGCGGGGTAAPAPSSSAPAAPTPTVAAADKGYCDTVARVQAEQASPQAGQGGVQKASDAARQQVGELVAAAPAELTNDWKTVQRLTEQALGSLAGTGGDPKKIDRDELAKLQQQSQPAVAHIKTVTEQRCHVAFRTPG
ncbi:hypothetical protein LQ327_06560 [Actinomycetospora endophytica]|uniref:Lipoprotein n=1 Tax=Actinomycetospora endophytica TaxID=2291215 RepID=A0ABS8P462_9PSEU|nr:hypothetical protein [Actinomycetospora endophytica]MCD2193051.1 hypothetical protein [Actinomycetospora endophytica]